MDNVKLELEKRKVVCGAEVIEGVAIPFPSCYRGQMARNREHREWNIGSEGKDNKKDGQQIN